MTKEERKAVIETYLTCNPVTGNYEIESGLFEDYAPGYTLIFEKYMNFKWFLENTELAKKRGIT